MFQSKQLVSEDRSIDNNILSITIIVFCMIMMNFRKYVKG